MILSDKDIELAIADGEIEIEPGLRPEMLQPASLDVCLGSSFLVRRHDDPIISVDPATEDPSHLFQKVTVLQSDSVGLVVDPGDFVLATTQEWFRLGDDIVGVLEGKSSLARLGIVVHQTAGFIDPGFQGEITLEISVAAQLAVQLRPGMPIAQLSFERLSSPARHPYRGRYFGQYGPTASRYFVDR